MASDTPATWHYGLVAKWWAEFTEDGPEIAYFQKHVERGQPALDVACGTGRLLIPFLRAGLDVDGCDVSADMIAVCREKAEREGLSPTLFVQPMHELEPAAHLQDDLRLRRLRARERPRARRRGAAPLLRAPRPGRHARYRQREPVLRRTTPGAYWRQGRAHGASAGIGAAGLGRATPSARTEPNTH